MENNILDILKSEDRAFDVHEIESALGFDSVDDLKELLKELNRLENEYKIYRTKKNK